jgi:hypothetical protein
VNNPFARRAGGTLEDMADDNKGIKKAKRPRGRRGRSRARQPVAADLGRSDDQPGDDGTAGVREPRRPKPKGPVSGAGVMPEPTPPLVAVLTDPRS